MNITIEDLLEALANDDTLRASTLSELKASLPGNPDAEMAVVVHLTGLIEYYDLTAQEEPLLIFSAKLIPA
jgi:hypothetical protein